jgi:hypothetical protein
MNRGRSQSLGARIAIRALACLLAAGLGGCWPWHHSEPTPQQQYLNALSRGQSAQASQIWLNMSPEDRIKWATSQGVSPSVSPEDVKNQVMKHYSDKMGGDMGGDDETIENVAPDLGGGGLGDLPKLATPPPQTPPPDSN